MSYRTAFEKHRVIRPLYTGGPVAVSSEGQHLITCIEEEACLTRLSDGEELHRFTADSETIHSLCLTPSSSFLALFSGSLSLHIYAEPLTTQPSRKAVRPTRTISKAHEAPVHVCRSDPTSTVLASGSADGVVKVWDIANGYVTHVFKGHGGVISALLFRYLEDKSTLTSVEPEVQLITASVDTRLRVFDLSHKASRAGQGKPVAILEGHVSVPRGLDLTKDGRWLLSGGRDAVALIWDFANKKEAKKGESRSIPTLVRTIPILERVEALGWQDEGEQKLRFFTAGEKGLVKLWNAEDGTCLDVLNKSMAEKVEQQEILDARYIPRIDSVLTVHADQNILFHSLTSRTVTQQLIGFNDEIVSTAYLSGDSSDSHLAVATNSELIRVYSTTVNDARLLPGHSGIVLSLDHSADRRMLASGSKDRSVRLWSYSESLSAWMSRGVCEGHGESVGSLAMSRKLYDAPSGKKCSGFIFSGSQDRTIKMWDLTSLPTYASDQDVCLRCKSLSTQKCHEKDINSLDVSPNDRYLASGSQDRTAKVYEINFSLNESGGAKGDFKLLGTCKGHKRGVWTVRFGKTERVLATGSGDKSIKLWNLDDFTCVKTFEGHTNSVLQLDFINHDMQLLSVASDGLLKTWNIRSEECIATMDNHEDKIWALAVSTDESFIATGAADSVVTIWKDCTAEKETQKRSAAEQTVLREQDYQNFMALKDYRSAISLALHLDQPGRLLSLFRDVLADSVNSEPLILGSKPTESHIHVVLQDISSIELINLLRHVRDWNANAKTSIVAQGILHALLQSKTVDELASAFKAVESADSIVDFKAKDKSISFSELVKALVPYTERHLARIDRLVQDSYVLDYVLGEMDGGLFYEGDFTDIEMMIHS